MNGQSYVPLGFQQISGLSSASSLVVSGRPDLALITVVSGAVAWRDDGVAPTPTGGMVLSAGQTLEYTGTISALQFISAGGTPVLGAALYRCVG